MREIKFRAWGVNIKEFLSPDGKVFGLTLKEIQNIEDISLWEFQQFTGLHDKNGKEIYEGDIVKTVQRTIMVSGKIGDIGAKQEYGEKYEQILEVYSEPAMWLTRHTNGGYCGHLITMVSSSTDSGGYTEVIGNIYENPELLPANHNQSLIN